MRHDAETQRLIDDLVAAVQEETAADAELARAQAALDAARIQSALAFHELWERGMASTAVARFVANAEGEPTPDAEMLDRIGGRYRKRLARIGTPGRGNLIRDQVTDGPESVNSSVGVEPPPTGSPMNRIFRRVTEEWIPQESANDNSPALGTPVPGAAPVTPPTPPTAAAAPQQQVTQVATPQQGYAQVPQRPLICRPGVDHDVPACLDEPDDDDDGDGLSDDEVRAVLLAANRRPPSARRNRR